MPKTTIDKHGNSLPGKHDVRSPNKLAFQPVPATPGPEFLSQNQFRFGVFAPDSRHAVASLFWCKYIHRKYSHKFSDIEPGHRTLNLVRPPGIITILGESDMTARVLDLFCGAGGSSWGAQAAGAEIVCGIDMWDIATSTFQHNFPDAVIKSARLENVKPKQLRDQIGDIDILLSSPECTNHTCAKGAAPRSEESRATAMQTIRFAKVFRPRWIIMENVVHMRPWSRYGEMKETIENLGYRIRETVLNSSDFGVGQNRRRLFVVCDREDTPPEIVPEHEASTPTVKDLLDKQGTWRSSPLRKNGRAKATLERAQRGFNNVGRETPFLIVYYGSDASGGWQRLDRPLRTITTVDRFALVEPSGKGHVMRMLQVPELKRAMGFSNDFKLSVGTRRDQVKLLGNGVCPPVMAQVVACAIEN